MVYARTTVQWTAAGLLVLVPLVPVSARTPHVTLCEIHQVTLIACRHEFDDSMRVEIGMCE